MLVGSLALDLAELVVRNESDDENGTGDREIEELLKINHAGALDFPYNKACALRGCLRGVISSVLLIIGKMRYSNICGYVMMKFVSIQRYTEVKMGVQSSLFYTYM